MKPKVYLAGKITGEDYQQCFQKFQLFEELIAIGNFEVINPMRIVPHGTHWDDAMDILKPHFINCEYAFFMGDWTESKGAKTEMKWAIDHGIKIILHADMYEFLRLNA